MLKWSNSGFQRVLERLWKFKGLMGCKALPAFCVILFNKTITANSKFNQCHFGMMRVDYKFWFSQNVKTDMGNFLNVSERVLPSKGNTSMKIQ